jgi:hypothetical protein
MGIADVSLGENFAMVFGLYCFKCKENFNFAFTLHYFSNEMKKLYAKDATKLRPPLKAIAPPVFTSQDLNFLTALKICDEEKV